MLDPEKDDEDSAVMVTDDNSTNKAQKKKPEEEDDEEDEEMEVRSSFTLSQLNLLCHLISNIFSLSYILYGTFVFYSYP